MSRLAAGLAAALNLVGAAVFFTGWASDSRTAYTGTPGAPPFSRVTPVTLEAGARACVSSVAIEPATRQAVFVAAPFTGTGAPVRVTVAGDDGFTASGSNPGGFTSRDGIAVTLPAPPRSTLATVCVRPVGRRRLRLRATTEARVQSRSRTTVGGAAVKPRVTLLLTEGRPRSIAGRLGEIADHVAAFKPFYVGRVSLYLLGLLVLFGVPLGVLAAIRAALRE